jgi:DNA repair exonuclease SbcCD nuclease subunit
MLVVHASDLHLGRPLRGLASHPGLNRDRFVQVGERALVRLVEFCLERKPTLLLIAGDLIDHWLRDYRLGLRLVHELSRLEYTGTRVFWVRGNHDAEHRVIRALLLPEHVHELGLNGVERRRLEPHGICLVGSSYPKRCTEENLFAAFPKPDAAFINIGLLHTSADGASTNDSYAPCGRRQLVSSGYQYVALGHVHEPQIISDKATAVAYSGCLQGRNFTESGPRGCLLVHFDDGRVQTLTHQALDVVRFGRIDVDISEATTHDEVLRNIALRCQKTLSQLAESALVVRFCLKGRRGLERLLCCSAKIRTQSLRAVTESLSDRLSVDGFWAHPEHPDAPALRLDEEQWVRRIDL